jgi:predicted DsbA family dithiol-disulfide isomerase
MHVEIFSDIACPWCYIGKRRFQEALANYEHADEVEIVWRSFELDPNAPKEETGLTIDKLKSKYGVGHDEAARMMAGAAREAATVGLEFRLENARQANTFDAHRLTHYAATVGLQEPVLEALMNGYQVDGEYLGSAETLERLAVGAGLDREAVRTVLSGDAYADAVREDETRARRLGVSGVPFFVFDSTSGISGAQSSDYFLQALKQLGPQVEKVTRFVPAGQASETAPARSAEAGVCVDDTCEVP